jgi:hypothetical protein
MWRTASGWGTNTKGFNEMRKELLESGVVRRDEETKRYFLVTPGREPETGDQPA